MEMLDLFTRIETRMTLNAKVHISLG